MSWEQRNGRRYYYRKRRKGGRVVSEYVGAGEFAKLCFIIDDNETKERLWKQATWRQEKTEIETFEKDQKSLSVLIRQILQAYFLVKGYHPHKGQWRKKKHGSQK